MSLDEIIDKWRNGKRPVILWQPKIDELVEALTQWADEQRVEELERLLKIDCFNEAYTTDPRPARFVRIRLEELKQTLTGGERTDD